LIGVGIIIASLKVLAVQKLTILYVPDIDL